MDPIMMKILDSSMVSVCREMGITLMQTSYSTIFNEALDFSCAIANTDGDMIACAEFCPAQIGGMPLMAKSIIKEIPLDDIYEGDVLLHNDPYRGGLHTPEHTFFKPIFCEGELRGFAVSIGHIAEVGGMVPGGFPGEATEIFHEGLRLPPIKIVKRGVMNDDVWKIILANVRTPRYNYGDLRALISAVDLGVAQMTRLYNKYGANLVDQTSKDLMDYSERRMRAEIEKIPDGIYAFEDLVEDDGIEDRQYKIAVEVHKTGSDVIADYTGSSSQAKGPINATLGVTMSATYNAMLHMTDPDIPKNSGCFRPIKVIAPPTTVVNVDFPAPEVGGNTETHPRIAGTVIGALAGVIPHLAMAAEGCTHGNFVFGGVHAASKEFFACYDIEVVGWGGRSFADGNDACDSINGNCRVTPVEVFEVRYPWRVKEWAFREDSGGPGKFRGGVGYTKTLECLNDEIIISQMTDRHKTYPWGLKGGLPGDNGATLFKQGGKGNWKNAVQLYGKASPSKYSNISIKKGDLVSLVMPAGGGYGDPKDRSHKAVKQDVAEGYVSINAAKNIYGL
jgi:N-methylhydantoinase B|tara:strand:+ start:2128 stop:3813 length:1686 start_codon:yes stop_codon:yes gene_type:complete